MLAHIDSRPNEGNFKPTVLDAIRMISIAWQEVKQETVKNCFRKVGWKKDDNSVLSTEQDDEDDLPLAILRERLQLPDSMSFEDYVRVDENVLSHEELSEADIVAELISDPTTQEEDEEEEEEEEVAQTESNPICSWTDARHYVNELRRFFEASGKTTDNDFFTLNSLDATLLKNVCQRQSSITDYFRN